MSDKKEKEKDKEFKYQVDDLRVLDVKKKRANQIIVHPDLWEHPSFLLIVSPPKSGKTLLLISAVYRWFNKVFDEPNEIWWCSPTFNLDNTLSVVKDDETIFKISDHEDLENIDKIIKSLIDKQLKSIDEGEQPKEILLILDDMGAYINKSKELNRLATIYRHVRISCWISIQKLRGMLNNTLRTCCSDVITFNLPNIKQKTALFEEIGSVFPDFENYYHEATKEKYHFMRMDLRNMKIYKGGPNGFTLLYEK